MSKILKAQNRLKADKSNKFTFLYNATQNTPPPNAALEDSGIKNPASEKPVNQFSPAALETVSKDNPETDKKVAPRDDLSDFPSSRKLYNFLEGKKAPTQRNSINLLKISILLLAAALIFLYLKNSEWKILYGHSISVLSLKLNDIDSRMTELRYSLSALQNKFSTEIAAAQKVHIGLIDGINEHGRKTYELTQNLNRLTTELGTVDVDLVNLTDSFQNLSSKFRIQENEVFDVKNKLKTLEEGQFDLKTKVGNVTERHPVK